MKTILRPFAAAALALAPLCAGASAQSPAGVVPVYDATQVAYDRYTVVKRIGVGDWRSALGIRAYGDLAAAQGAVLSEAAQAGADGVVNLTCFDQTDRVFRPAGYFCYGNAIRLKK
jgi:hypothetical protein